MFSTLKDPEPPATEPRAGGEEDRGEEGLRQEPDDQLGKPSSDQVGWINPIGAHVEIVVALHWPDTQRGAVVPDKSAAGECSFELADRGVIVLVAVAACAECPGRNMRVDYHGAYFQARRASLLLAQFGNQSIGRRSRRCIAIR